MEIPRCDCTQRCGLCPASVVSNQPLAILHGSHCRYCRSNNRLQVKEAISC